MRTIQKRPKRAMLIGLDAAVIELVQQFAAEGRMPHIRRLLERGVLARLLPPYPTITPPNWATIATGAWPGTHGIPSFEIYYPGDPLDLSRTGFGSELCQAETLWEAADRAGRRSILMKYWGTWPPKVKSAIQVEGTAVSFFRGESTPILELSLGHFFTTADLVGRDQEVVQMVQVQPATDWAELPEDLKQPLETILTLGLLNGGRKLLYTLLENRGQGYRALSLAWEKDYSRRVATVEADGWVNLRGLFPISGGIQEGIAELKLQKLTPDGHELEVYLTPIYPTHGFTQPEELGPELIERFGPFSPKIQGRLEGAWVSDETYYEWYHRHNQWQGEASAYLMGKYDDWTLFCMQNHCFDHIQHVYLTKYDPATAERRQHHAWFEMPTPEMAQRMLPRFYESVDQMVGKILTQADEETLVMVVSDHGANASLGDISVNQVLRQAGFIVDKVPTATKGPVDDYAPSRGIVDWSRTKAYAPIRGHIFLNVKGRQPEGIVEPGEEYEEVRDQLIEALYDYRDPTTGKRAFSLVLKREDAAILGQFGEKAGDLVAAVRPELVGHEHGLNLPTAKYGLGSAGCLFIMAGPGVKQGLTLKSLRWLTDVAPTIAHLVRIPVPRQCEGGIIYDALEDPDSLVRGDR